MKYEIEVEGLWEVIEKLQELTKECPEATVKALYQVSQEILAEAKKQTPVDTGALRASGYVKQEGTEITIGFGGPSAPYALWVHERTELRHRVGKAKFLEDAVREYLPRFEGEVAKRVKEEIE